MAVQSLRAPVWNRSPLAPARFATLPLGSIRARGWLAEQLRLLAQGFTGRLMEVWPDVGRASGWLGGDGESWERGPYYVRGLVSLARATADPALLALAQEWIEWSLQSQRDDGFFGPASNDDWWPRMPMLEALRLHHDATADPRVLAFLQRYFRYQLAELPLRPLHFWGKPRGGDNLESVLWLYNHTGDSFLLELADLLHAQTSDWIAELGGEGAPSQEFDFGHGVNLAMGLKQPALWSQRSGNPDHLAVVRRGWERVMQHHAQVQGTYSCDEFLHGRSPTQGSELCTAVELLSSFETILKIGGGSWCADAIERIAFNALPAFFSPDLCARQYFQLANQIECTPGNRNFHVPHGSDLLFGLETGYGCCTANLHLAWPQLAHHLWLATPDGGLAAPIYAACEVTATLDGTPVTISETTDYPFDGEIQLTITAPSPARFPLYLRLPQWTESFGLRLNGREQQTQPEDGFIRIERSWRDDDTVSLRLSMTPVERDHPAGDETDGVTIECGPLVFVLPIAEDWRRVTGSEPFGDYEVHPTSAWNYGLRRGTTFALRRRRVVAQPWTSDAPPVRIGVGAQRLPNWQAQDGVAGPPAASEAESVEKIELVPFGAARLRIAVFPAIA